MQQSDKPPGRQRCEQMALFKSLFGSLRAAEINCKNWVIAHGVGKKGCAGSRNMSERMDGEAAALPPE
jgi:hypothetical protein